MPKRHPPIKMIRELNDVFEKHNWSGEPIGIKADKAVDGGGCPAGTTPKQITYQLPDGTWVTKTICA
jgi:hypothetical protein